MPDQREGVQGKAREGNESQENNQARRAAGIER
jgi:hypothetical protein